MARAAKVRVSKLGFGYWVGLGLGFRLGLRLGLGLGRTDWELG